MCLFLFMASDVEIPQNPWSAGKSDDMYVREILPNEAVVRRHFTKPYIYKVGAWQECACNFQYNVDEEDRRSINSLFEFLRAELKRTDKIELFSCLAGEEEEALQVFTTIHMDKYKEGDIFGFEKKQFISIVP